MYVCIIIATGRKGGCSSGPTSDTAPPIRPRAIACHLLGNGFRLDQFHILPNATSATGCGGAVECPDPVTVGSPRLQSRDCTYSLVRILSLLVASRRAACNNSWRLSPHSWRRKGGLGTWPDVRGDTAVIALCPVHGTGGLTEGVRSLRARHRPSISTATIRAFLAVRDF